VTTPFSWVNSFQMGEDRPLSYLLPNGYEESCMIPCFRLLFRVQDQARLRMRMLEVPLETNDICPRMFWLQQV